ncbi:hypothetical protein D9R08_03565 [Rhodophyticola porphyridii]|uniref:Uncharacterized protein n=1 Tax=Rhodophyticola porphyridii TaxID=1852017 RepID=A0A3L9Y5K6_9RHOB|nr:hypothetical protein D9R08_03565 [Rhodophyticola porphyridii]
MRTSDEIDDGDDDHDEADKGQYTTHEKSPSFLFCIGVTLPKEFRFHIRPDQATRGLQAFPKRGLSRGV